MFGDLSKCQTGTSLKINIVRIHQSAQGAKRFAREEIGFIPLWSNANNY